MSAEPVRCLVAWRGLDAFRAEAASVWLWSDRLVATGTQIGAEPLPYRLGYGLETGAGFVTELLVVEVHGDGWMRKLDLRRAASGEWTCGHEHDGEPDLPAPVCHTGEFAEALDCDLGLCPLTNTMPVRRSGLMERAGAEDFVMAWVSVPDLRVLRAEQRYEHVRRAEDGAVVRYVDPDFVAEIEFDADGLVMLYPELAERL